MSDLLYPKERPILFSAPMVRAILDGRKTQTRRVFKRRTGITGPELDPTFRCPYGSPGDRLWVRETWRVASSGRNYPSRTTTVYAEYRERSMVKPQSGGAQHRSVFVCSDRENDALLLAAYGAGKPTAWRPSIHMPRWASRITLEVTDVRLERLQDISEEDAKAEGVATRCLAEPDESPECSVGFRNPDGFALDNFRSLWDAINGAESWDANPWVWVVSFRRLQP